MEKGRGSLLFRRAPVLVEVGLQQAVHQKGGQAQKDHLPPDEPQKQRPQQAPAKIRRPGGHHRQGQAQPDPQFGQVGVGKAPGILVLLRQLICMRHAPCLWCGPCILFQMCKIRQKNSNKALMKVFLVFKYRALQIAPVQVVPTWCLVCHSWRRARC